MFEPKRKVGIKYSLNPSRHFSHFKIVNYVGSNKKVLDVGCATGYLAKNLKENDCYVTGIEINVEAGKIARMFCDEVIIADIEKKEELPLPRKFFDVIIYGDILEHLKRPDLVLMKLKEYLADSGYTIACIPNIAYYRNRIKLLFGRFQYQETGTLDLTHLRFFTLKTAKELFESCGYEVSKIDFTGACSYLHKIFPNLLAFQFIIIAKKSRY